LLSYLCLSAVFFFLCARLYDSLFSSPTRRSSDLFTLALGRPHLYRVTWSKLDGLPVRGKRKRRVGTGSPASIDGAAWNAGSGPLDRKSTRLNSSHQIISYAVFCLIK